MLLAPVFLPGVRVTRAHVAAALMGFAGAAVAILGRGRGGGAFSMDARTLIGFACALAAAFNWASYSLLTKRLAMTGRGFPTAAIGGFGLISGLLSLACHALMEPAATLSARDWGLIALLGLGPLGGSFFLWDAALKRGDARQIGVLAYLTPLLSTFLLLWSTRQAMNWNVALATALILAAAALGTRSK